MSNVPASSLFEAIVMVCAVGVQPTVETCSIPTLCDPRQNQCLFTNYKLCRDTIEWFMQSIPPGRRVIMADCAPAAVKKAPTRRVDLD